ncbi:hypothetical protein BDD12DRAFT_809432 [Trichophaea hybrida]|nr:hypothetical protein BDD12DRAFT_809432 [Trichophaea hybrida]
MAQPSDGDWTAHRKANGFTAPRPLDDVSNDDKWAHLTQSKNNNACMISTDESTLKVQRMCRDRLAQGRPHGKVAVIATHRIRTPIRRALTEVLGFAELEHRPDTRKVLQRIGTEWWVYANIPPHSIEEILTYEEFLALKARIRAFNSPKRAPSATWAPEGTPGGKTGEDQLTNGDRKPDNKNMSPTIWQRAGLRGPPEDNSRHPPPSPSRKWQNMPGSTAASADTTTAPTTTDPNASTSIESIPPSWEKDSTQSLSLRYQSTQETILVRPQEIATGLSEIDSLPPNRWPSASEGSQDAAGTKRRNRSKKNTPSGLWRIQRRKHLQGDTEGANPSEDANGGRLDAGTGKSVSNWPSYDEQNNEFNQILLESPKGLTKVGRRMGKTEGQEQDVQVPKMRIHGERRKEVAILGTDVYRTFSMTERSIYQAFLFLALFEMFSVEFYATVLLLANLLGERPKLENRGRKILILFGTVLCLPKTQAAPLAILDSTMAPPGWALAASAVVAAQAAITTWNWWKQNHPTPAQITARYVQNMRAQADKVQGHLEILIAQQNTSNSELNEGLARYNSLVKTHNEMVQTSNQNEEEILQKRRELAEIAEKLKEYERQTAGNLEEIKKLRKELEEDREKISQLTEAAKEGGDSSQTVAKLQEELENAKKATTDRVAHELVQFSKLLSQQVVATLDVIREMLGKTTNRNKTHKCGCTLNGKEPDKFDGKNPEKFLSWFTRVENYVGGQLHRIATAKDIRIILFSMLEENALEYAIEACPEGHSDPTIIREDEETLKIAEYNTIIDWLTEQFKDTLMTQKLVAEWEKCYQNEEQFQTWIIQYERIIKRAGPVARGNHPTEIGACHDLWRRLKKSLKEHYAIRKIKDHGTYAVLRKECLMMDGYTAPGERFQRRDRRGEGTQRAMEQANKYTPAQLEKLKEKAKNTPCRGPAASCRLRGGSEIDPTGRRGQGGRPVRKDRRADRDGRGKKDKNGSKE